MSLGTENSATFSKVKRPSGTGYTCHSVSGHLSILSSCHLVISIQSCFDHPCGDLTARGKTEPGHNIGNIPFYRALADDQRLGDGAVGVALGDERGHLPLAAG